MTRPFIITFLALSILITPALVSCGDSSSANHSSELKAAIVDQLDCVKPAPEFVEQAKGILEAYGFTVDIWRGDEVTVSLYRELPAHGYKLILFRAHLGVLCLVGESEVIPTETTCLFTAEPYTTTRHVFDQLNGTVLEGQMTEEYPTVFTISPEFVTDTMTERFDGTVILMMGCASYYLDDMASAFVEKGASVYVGWSATVTADYVDAAALNLIDKLCTKGRTVEQTTSETMGEVGPDPYYRAGLEYYPAKSGSKTIGRLIR